VNLQMDPEFASMVQMLFRTRMADKQPAPGDWQTKRIAADRFFITISQALTIPRPVVAEDRWIPGYRGSPVRIRLYRPEAGTERRSLVIYLHGGGMFCCSIDTHDRLVRHYCAKTRSAFLAVDFRFAPEHPYPASVEDVFAALAWAAEHAGELGTDPGMIALAGDSAGGGMAAAVSLMTRDRRGPQVALQMLLYPMLDDRNTVPDPELEPFVAWAYDDNALGWSLLLGDRAGGPDVPAWASPARETDYKGLAPAYLEVGTLDIFRDETLRYAANLLAAGVPTKLHLRDGVTHGFDMLAPQAAISQQAFEDRYRAIINLGK
jgi:acetyl esterase/lipase